MQFIANLRKATKRLLQSTLFGLCFGWMVLARPCGPARECIGFRLALIGILSAAFWGAVIVAVATRLF
jgi:hypothetical protein